MKLRKYLLTLTCILSIVVLGAANMPLQQDEKPKNLQVLNKDISIEALDKIMHQYNEALGVKCNYCHAAVPNDLTKLQLDYASDAKSAKKIARDMMRMTTQINQQFFNAKDKDGNISESVSCITCHNGQEYPAFNK
jgi:hypothetical protein